MRQVAAVLRCSNKQLWREPEAVKEALGDNDRKLLKGLTWGMRRNPQDWTDNQVQAMDWLQRTSLQSARAWRCRLEPFKKLAKTLAGRLIGLLQQAKRADKGFKTAKNFIAITYLRMSKLKNLPPNPLQPALPLPGRLIDRCL